MITTRELLNAVHFVQERVPDSTALAVVIIFSLRPNAPPTSKSRSLVRFISCLMFQLELLLQAREAINQLSVRTV